MKARLFILFPVIILILGACAYIQINHVPQEPSNPRPYDGETDVSLTPTLTWDICSDPDGDIVTYDVYFGKSPYPSLVETDLSTNEFSPGVLEANTTYYWKIVAKDEHGSKAIGPIWHFTTVKSNQAPETPSSPTPYDGARNIILTPTLKWKACSDPDGDAVVYDIYFGKDPDPPLFKGGLSKNEFSPGTLKANTTYYWKVVAKDTYGNESSGPIWSFKTIYFIASIYDHSLDENYYTYVGPIHIDDNGNVYGAIRLTHWDGDYGLEILFMDSANFNLYRNGASFSAWHKSIYTTGEYEFCFVNIPPGYYYLIVDNTNLGWDDTDFDGINDYAVFDLEAVFLYK